MKHFNAFLFVATLSLFVSTSQFLSAQNGGYPAPPCALGYSYTGVASKQGQALTAPAYTTDMPIDVLVGYIVIDSLRKVKTPDEIEAYLNSLDYSNDTLRRIMKYLYTIVDYDPIRFRRYAVGTSVGRIAASANLK